MSFCKVKGCKFKSSHVTLEHTCETCGKYGHGKGDCKKYHNIPKLSNIEGLEERAFEVMGNQEGKIYVCIQGELGCSFWYRRISRNMPLQKLFMHQDDWGQYGLGKVAEHASFINGYRTI